VAVTFATSGCTGSGCNSPGLLGLHFLRCGAGSKFRRYRGHCGHTAGPAGAQVRGLMTHCRPKFRDSGNQDSAVQHGYRRCAILLAEHRRGLTAIKSASEEDYAGHQAARIHRCARRRGGMAARSTGTSARSGPPDWGAHRRRPGDALTVASTASDCPQSGRIQDLRCRSARGRIAC
jgi:hypothetical protein